MIADRSKARPSERGFSVDQVSTETAGGSQADQRSPETGTAAQSGDNDHKAAEPG